MPDEFANKAFDESFDDGTSDVFKFDKGAQITDGKLLLTKSMGNATAGVSYLVMKSLRKVVWILVLTGMLKMAEIRWDLNSGIHMEDYFLQFAPHHLKASSEHQQQEIQWMIQRLPQHQSLHGQQ